MRVTHAISVRAPYAAQIVSGAKSVEYRSWRLPVKYLDVPIALHESAGPILAVITFDRCEESAEGFAWRVGSVRPLRPVAAPGAFLRFWKLAPATARAVRRQLALPKRWNDDTAACACALCGTRKATSW